MSATLNTSTDKQSQRVHAVLALLRGDPVEQVSARYRICRSTLYKFRRRAQMAIEQALRDKPRGPRRPSNRVEEGKERTLLTLCQRYATFSARHVARKFGTDAPSLRTIQRIRRRHQLGRFPKRAPTTVRARRLTPREKKRVWKALQDKPRLGPERLAWDLHNGEGIIVSPSTMKRLKEKRRFDFDFSLPKPPKPVWRFYERKHPHSLWHGDFLEKVTLTDCDQTAYHFALLDDYSRGYVFCDLFMAPDMRTTIRGLIAAMRQWRVIPEAVVFDNGASFKGKLLSVFCANVGIRLIHSSVYHPQTNGKLERAFRDDMRDFYQHYDEWLFEPLQRDLPAYVHYRNTIRGHRALGGKPSITRLKEAHERTAPQEVLDNLENQAGYEVARKVTSATGTIRLFGRDAHVGLMWANTEVVFWESLEGLEARVDGTCIAILRDYRTYLKMTCSRWWDLPSSLSFEACQLLTCPRIAVAS
jgi:transposase InsO family protein